MDTVDSRPGGYERHDPRYDIDERVGRVILVLASPPQLIKTGTTDDQGWIQFEAV